MTNNNSKYEQDRQKIIDSQKSYLHTAHDVRKRLIKFLSEINIPELHVVVDTNSRLNESHYKYHEITITSQYREATYMLYHTHVNMTTRKQRPPNVNKDVFYDEEKSVIYTYEDPLLIGLLLYPFEDLMIRKHQNEELLAMAKKVQTN